MGWLGIKSPIAISSFSSWDLKEWLLGRLYTLNKLFHIIPCIYYQKQNISWI